MDAGNPYDAAGRRPRRDGVFPAIFLTGRVAPKHYGGAADLSLYWHFVALGWVPLYLLLYLAPDLLRCRGWLTLLGPPLAWSAALSAGYFMGGWACGSGAGGWPFT